MDDRLDAGSLIIAWLLFEALFACAVQAICWLCGFEY